MNTNMIGFKWFSKKCCILVFWTKVALALEGLTHSCLEIHLTGVVWTCHSFENNFGIIHEFAIYLKENYSSDEKFSFKLFLNIAFVREIYPI